MLNLAEVLDRAAEKWPTKALVVDGGRWLRYEEFRTNVARWTSYLESEGVAPSDVVAVFSRNRVELLYLWIATSRCGAIFAPFNYNLKATEISRLVSDARPKILFTDSDLSLEVTDAAGPKIVDFGQVSLGKPSETLVATDPDDVATLLYTSGTEDLPKGVMNTHLNWFATLQSALHDLDFAHDDVFLLSIPLYHVAGLYTFLAFSFVGATIVLGTSPTPAEIDRAIRENGVTYLIFPPTLFVALSQYARAPYDSVKKCISFGAFISGDQFDAIARIVPSAQWRNYYGLTESTPVGTTLQPADFASHKESIGKPHIHVGLRLVKEDGSLAGPGEVGEIHLRSPSVARGYHGQPEQTERTFGGGWLRTGDLARQDSDGFLYFVDRKKDVVRTGGENVSSVEVERELLRDSRVAEAAVVGLPHSYWGEAVTAFITPKKGAQPIDDQELTTLLKDRLASYKVPKKIVVLDALPHNPSGKVLKKELKRKFAQAYRNDEPTTGPRD